MDKEKRVSPAMQLIEFVKYHKMKKCPWSRQKSGNISDWAWQLAVKGGFEFYKGDFGEPGSWIGEGLYAAAILEQNMTAVHAMEYAANRKPFIALEIEPHADGPMMAHMAGSRHEGRLAVGFQFWWQGKRVTVTSFAKDSSHVVACSYPEGGYHNLPHCDACGQPRYDLRKPGPDKPDHIYKITPEELRAGRAAERKKHPKCKLCLAPIAEGKEICDEPHECIECHGPVKTAKDGKRTTLNGRYRDGQVVCNTCIEKHEIRRKAR